MSTSFVAICIEKGCKNSIVITQKDRDYFKARGYVAPRRCHRCRVNRRPLIGGMYHPLGGEHKTHLLKEQSFYDKHNRPDPTMDRSNR